MKKIIICLVYFTFAYSLTYAQMAPESVPDEQLTEEQATLRIQDWQSKVNDLKTRLQTLKDEVEGLKKGLDQAKADLNNCNDEILKLVGASLADIEAFRQKLGVIDGKVRQMKGYSNDQLADMKDQVIALENDLNELRRNKIAVLPEFFQKIQDLARDIKGLYREKSVKTYTVGTWAQDRDCLWNIAGKMEIYGDPFLWPKIWQTNKELIRNPDIIHPGQVLTLPVKGPKDSDEQKAERRYWRQKRAAMDAAKEQSKTPEPAKPAKKGE